MLCDSVFDAASQTYRYPVQARGADGFVVDADGDPILTGATVEDGEIDPINLALDGLIDVTLGSFKPTASAPTQNVQMGGQLPGTYAGVEGMFRCNGAEATAQALDGCDITAVGGEDMMAGPWQFVPSAANVSIADSDFLVFGAWLKRPESQVGVGYSAGISSTSMPYDNNGTTGAGVANGIALTALTGKATYEGSAAGHFAERFIGTEEAKSGRFTATAELTADFGTYDVPDADNPSDTMDEGSIKGTITDFVRDDGVAANWVVSLNEVDFVDVVEATATTPLTAPGGFVSGSTGGHAAGANWSGQWGVQLAGGGGNNEHPTGVVGTFGAEFGMPVHLTDELDAMEATADEGFVGVIGGFGARKVAE